LPADRSTFCSSTATTAMPASGRTSRPTALVRGGGLIALHDITPGRDPTIEVPRFWSELKRTRPVEELVAGDESFGIGLVHTGTTDVEYP
jgi:hypothetical protein